MTELYPEPKRDAAGRKPKPFSFRTRMLVCFGLIFAMGVIADGIFGLYGIPFTEYGGEYGLRRSEAFRDLNVLADTKKAELLQLVAERQGDAATVCNSPVLRRLVSRVSSLVQKKGGAGGEQTALLHADDGSLLSGHLNAIKQSYMTFYDKIRIVDAASGVIIASTNEGDLGTVLSGDPGLAKASRGEQEEIINVLRDAASGDTYLAILHEIRGTGDREGGENAVKGVLILYLKPEVIVGSLHLDGRELGETGEIFLVDQDGQLLTPLKRPLPSGNIPRPMEFRMDTRPALLAAEGNEGIIATDYAGVPVLAALRHLRLNSETGWGMVISKEEGEVYAPIRQLMVYFALKTLFISLLVLGLVYATAANLSRPIRQLSRTASRVAEGDLDARSLADGPDEVGLLSHSFNSMVERLQNWHHGLEAQVRARTVELVSLNEELYREVEERRRVEEALRTSERRFRELLENVQLVAVIVDRDGSINFCNDFLLDLTGWSREEVEGRNWFDLFIPGKERELVKTVFAGALATATVPLHYENSIMTRTGALRTIVWDNTLFRDVDGTVIGTASLGTDVTVHRSLEEQLRQSQKMEAIGQMAGGIAHDFNNLLTVIMGSCELMKLETGEDDPLREYVEQILLVSGKAARLTHDLLAFSRRQLLTTRVVEVNECVRGVERLLARLIGADVDFRLGLTEVQLPVMADRGQMEQVLVNLSMNARDAMPGGGELVVETRQVDLDQFVAKFHGLEKGGSYAVIQISDTGCGMDECTRKRIFEPFFTTKEAGKGTGLGLAMVFGTIRQHGGYIDVYSEVGKGTVFKIYLPLIQGESAGSAGDGHAGRK